MIATKLSHTAVAAQIGAPDPWRVRAAQQRQDLTEQGLKELGQHIEDLDRNGGDYMRACIVAIINGRTMPRACDHGLHPDFAKGIREIALDLDVAYRRAA